MDKISRLMALVFLLATASFGKAHADDQVEQDLEAARKIFQAGAEHYEKQEYEQALQKFETAYLKKPHPDLLFNIARCHDKLGHWQAAIDQIQAAIDQYKVFLGTATRLEDVAKFKQSIEELEVLLKVVEEKRPAAQEFKPPIVPVPQQPPPPSPPPIESHPPLRALALPLGVGAAALALAVVGTALVAEVKPHYDELAASWKMQPSHALEAQARDLQMRTNLGYAFWAVAAITAAVDVGLWIYAMRKGRADRHAWIAPLPGGITAGGTF